MKTFTSFWLLCTPVKGNFILICVDGKSMKVTAAYQKLHEVRDTASLALHLIKSTACEMAACSLCWGTQRSTNSGHSDSFLTPPPSLGTPRGPQKATLHQKSENVNQDTFTLFMMRYLWCQESRPAGLLGPFQTSAPAGHETYLLQTSFPLPMLTHTPKQLTYKNTYQQIILNVWKLINSKEIRATENLIPVPLLKTGLGMDNRRDISTNTNSLKRVILMAFGQQRLLRVATKAC